MSERIHGGRHAQVVTVDFADDPATTVTELKRVLQLGLSGVVVTPFKDLLVPSEDLSTVTVEVEPIVDPIKVPLHTHPAPDAWGQWA
ncbi:MULTISPECIES: hypothetical protein [unclassified Streptomyces]|uniref:hypothetical protein n=1 Tax=unclassified Streptomyces TaxID=2593676 RepID=UPI0011B9458C|nr:MULTISPECIES: hypothetical protein [unclassified Streptomyces]MYT70709.1 hypothetical protein [Streptomyces sp. SID8367]